MSSISPVVSITCLLYTSIDAVKKIIAAGIPIMGHLGLIPQSINKYGTYTVRAKDEEEAEKLLSDAHLLEEAGCFAYFLLLRL